MILDIDGNESAVGCLLKGNQLINGIILCLGFRPCKWETITNNYFGMDVSVECVFVWRISYIDDDSFFFLIQLMMITLRMNIWLTR